MLVEIGAQGGEEITNLSMKRRGTTYLGVSPPYQVFKLLKSGA